MRVSFIHALTRAWSLPTWRLSKLVVIWILTGQPRLTGFGLWVLFSRVNDRRSFLVPGLGTRPDHFTSKLSDPALARSTRRNQRIFVWCLAVILSSETESWLSNQQWAHHLQESFCVNGSDLLDLSSFGIFKLWLIRDRPPSRGGFAGKVAPRGDLYLDVTGLVGTLRPGGNGDPCSRWWWENSLL